MKTAIQVCSIIFVGLFFALTLSCGKGSSVESPVISIPTVITTAATSVTSTEATLGGNISNDGGATVTERGVVYATTQTPNTSNTKVVVGTGVGSFTTNVTGLTSGTTYYVRAYAVNSKGTAYGSQETFACSLTLSAATVTTTAATGVTATGATLGGNVTNDGNATVTERGVVYATTQTPTTSNTKVVGGTGTGSFTTSVTGLISGTAYYVRAYAINSQGTAYGSQESFTCSLTLSIPTVTTTAATSVTSTGATLGGNVSADGNATVSERGVVYSTTQTPTVSNTKIVVGNGTGSFTTNVTGLTSGTTYYVRAYAINSQGTAYGSQETFTASPTLSLPTVTTAAATTVTSTGATLGGNVTTDGNVAVTERGVVYATTPSPTTSNTKIALGNGTGSFTTNITGLTAGTTYYVRAYAINSQGTAYGSQETFTASLTLSLPNVTTAAATTVTNTGVTLGGNVTADGNVAITERGIVYATTQTPTVSNTKIVVGNGTGSFTTNVTGLTSGTTYYVRAYAINSQGTAYGSQETFTCTLALSVPTITTTPTTNVTSSGATLGGNVTSDGNATVSERGVVYATTPTPTTSNTKIVVGNGTGSFTTNVTGLTSGTTYYVRAYAINSQGTAYGSQETFITSLTLSLPSVSTTAATTVNSTGATLGGNVIADGNAAVTERGIVYSTTQTPTTSNTKIAVGNGTGSFTTSVTGLTSGTTYYVRAYAINSQGTAYGSQETFTCTLTLSVPTITTTAVTNITSSGATLGGNVTSDGNATVSERGVVYATTQTPTTSNTKIALGNGTGSFTTSVTGLTSGSTYYVRAYAINSQGTAYGLSVPFTTNSVTGSTVTDIDGNVYSTVTIGTQIWMGSNLKTTKYNDGTAIPLVTDNAALTPGYSWYNNATTNKDTYGALYNWYAVSTSKLCPTGWHVPTDSEWSILTAYLGANLAGDKLKETGTSHWLSPNSATNSTGFTAIPGGYRDYGGAFLDVGNKGYWWSSTEDAYIMNALSRVMNYSGSSVQTDNYGKRGGYSVRCLKGETTSTVTVPTVITTTASSVTSTTATSGGNVTSDGGASVTASGVCWSTTTNPTITSNSKTTDSSGTGSFSSSITGLTAGTIYYVRAYAINNAGTAYGLSVPFTTTSIQIQVPTITTTAASSVTMTSAASGGNISSDGGSIITARGVCWATTSTPTTADSKTTDAGTTGIFTSSITGLTAGTTYYIRAYATNSAGTAYGNNASFTTAAFETVTDVDGNIYQTVTVGNLVYMASNLKVTKYNDNTAIPYLSDPSATPSYSWYNNDATNKSIYGALYNWYAVNTGKLCPTGWHVPTNTETLGHGDGSNAGKFKEIGTSHWQSPNTGATNTTGVTLLPGGYMRDGQFFDMGISCNLWSSTEYSASNAWFGSLVYNSSAASIINEDKRAGFSIRCIKN